MTEHRKITVPGASLFERAEDLSGDSRLVPAPVPETLASPVNRPARAPVLGSASGAKPASARARGPASPRVQPPVTFDGAIHPIDPDLLAHNGLIQPGAPASGLLEEFRIVKRRVLEAMRTAQQAGGGAQAQRVLICSPLPEEGKTFCAANLALALAAEKDSEVLLVDADFARPSILSVLGLPSGPGFMDVLADPAVRLEDCVIATDIPDLYVLPAGSHTHADSEFLASNRTEEVLDRMTRGVPNRLVIFDSPPALAASPAAELAGHVGQAIVVARADRTGESALEDALTLLSACPDIKLLLNAAHFSPSGRRFGAYYGREE